MTWHHYSDVVSQELDLDILEVKNTCQCPGQNLEMNRDCICESWSIYTNATEVQYKSRVAF